MIDQYKKRKRKDEKPMAKKVKCPKCKSLDSEVISQDKKHSLVKGVVGGAVFGLVGAAVGVSRGAKIVTFRCNNCGNIFEIKL